MADITSDGVADFVINAVEGKTLAVDGATYDTLWEFSLPNTEVNCYSAVVGRLTTTIPFPIFSPTTASAYFLTYYSLSR